MRGKKDIRGNNETAIRLARECADGLLDFYGVMDPLNDRFHRKRRSTSLETRQIITPPSRGRVRIEHEDNAPNSGIEVFEHFEPLAAHGRIKIGEAGCIAAGMREACEEPPPN